MRKLLIFTQKIDENDPILGFFVGWVKDLSEHTDFISVVCLQKGNYNLPDNVSVLSLGKERKSGKLLYVVRFFKILFNLRGRYSAVFVHMNQEYILLGGLFWRFLKIPVFFWRNHARGNLLTDISILLSNKIFCASKDAYVSKSKKTILMPVGVDLNLFREDKNISKNKNSVCMVGRISPVKRIDVCLEAISILIKEGIQVSLTILGPCPERDLKYLNSLKDFVLKNDLSPYVKFFDGVSLKELSKIYNSHEIFVNLTESGSYDKTIIEACSCGVIPLVSNKSVFEYLPEVCTTEDNPQAVARSLKVLLKPETKVKIEKNIKNYAENNSLDNLMKKLSEEIKFK